ncbi:Uncharacterized protein FWK35_00010827 [Aphis craccivora]|uniref:Uncharacterized protein n=1 Tax=Aphis craccivora TaxID=307492 RepID=A0A6G0YYZ6_APHCR|nr:Uncharacterized protein FWK35_00010827 [Aphis craccivora]
MQNSHFLRSSLFCEYCIIFYLHSERSDERIDFTMLCVFFCVCVYEKVVEIMLQIETLGLVSDSKMNLVGALRGSFFEFFNSFQKRRKKREFLRKSSFRPIRFFYMVFKFLRNLSKTRKFANN